MSEPGDARVAVVMITYNRRGEVLRSLAQLTSLPERPPIILVDNGSADGTPAAVRETFPEIQVIEAGRNLGASGRTLGVERAGAPYIALCDDDTWWRPGCLKRAADLFDAQSRLGVLCARILVNEEQFEDPVCAELLNSPLPRAPGMPGPALLGFMAGASVVRRSAFLQAGGFHASAAIGGEEELLAIDLASRGWWLCYVPDLVVHHHPSPRRDSSARRTHLVRNALWFAWRRRPLGSALRRTWRELRGAFGDAPARRGLWQAFQNLPSILRERRVVPPEVERGLRLLEACARQPMPETFAGGEMPALEHGEPCHVPA